MHRRMLVLAATAACMLFLAALATSAQASSIYTVGTTADLTGACTPASGTCSLRQLIEYENGLEPTKEPDAIIVPAGTYALTDEELRIEHSVAIIGAGARSTNVVAAPDRRVLNVELPDSNEPEPPNVAIEGLEISGGEESDGGEGGDIYNGGGDLGLVEDWITEGKADEGSGIFNESSGAKEPDALVLERSLVSGNLGEEGGQGGGIESESFEEEKAVLAVEDSTVADNTATRGAGILGLGVQGEAANNRVAIIDSTIAQNQAEAETGAAAGAGLLARASQIEVAGSIVAENAGKQSGANTESNCATEESGTITSLLEGYNLENGFECGFTATGDLQGVNPEFSPNALSDNGGNTDTLAPALTSRAVDAIPTSFEFCNGNEVDQRGVVRPQGSDCDIGAVEYERAASKGLTPGPPTVSNVHVVSVTTTTATIGFTINPDGADTTYVVDYGPTTGYGQETERVNIGETAGEQSLTRTITGLQSNHTYHFDVVATNALAATGARSADQPFTTPAATFASLPEPALGKTANVEPVSGTVLIAVPGAQAASAANLLERGLSSPAAAFESLSKGLHFVPLTEARQIPVGSVLETTHGVVALETATTSSKKPQFGDFGAGIFKLLQARKQKGLAELDIMDTHTARQVCATLGKGAAVAAKLSSKVLGRLNANAHGKFTTKGQYSAATVRGTVWSVTNQCDGTLTKVQRGVVSVRDFVRRRTITLFTGQHYLARAP
jgi:hypothetical protein